MSLAYSPDRLRLPDSLQAQLHEFRRRVWTIKMVEAVAAAAFGILVAYLLLFGLDRVWDTPGWLRAGLVRDGRGGLRQCARGPAPLGLAPSPARATGPALGAQAPAGRRPVAGDHRAGPQRFRASAVARAVRGGDPRGGARRPAGVTFATPCRTRGIGSGSWLAAVPLAIAAGLVRPLSRPPPPTPGSGSSSPWNNAPRYTFTMLEPLPGNDRRRPRRAVHRRAGAQARDHSLASARRCRPAWRPAPGHGASCATAVTSSSCRRRSIRARCGSQIGDATRATCASSRPCGPS